MWLASDEVPQRFVEPEPDHKSLPPTPPPPPCESEVGIESSATTQAPTDTTYSKLKKGLSKRYAMPFPLLKSASFSGRPLPEKKKNGNEP